jgi:hypothetical protein
MPIVQGDNILPFPFIVKRVEITSLEGATIKVAIKRGKEIINKIAEIIDPTVGKCQFTLLKSDLTVSGNYQFQWTADFEDGRNFSGKTTDFFVSEKLTGVPSIPGGEDILVKVDGGEF